MKGFTRSALSLLMALPAAIAEGELGFCLPVKLNDGTCKYQADYESDFDTIADYTKTVRVYAESDCNTLEYLGPALVAKGFKAFLGVWPTDDTHYEEEKTALSTYLPSISIDNVAGFTVGSEVLYRGDLTASELTDKINDFKSFIADIKDKDGNSYSSLPVGTADSWNLLIDAGNEDVIQACDVIFANAFPYWQGQVMSNASYSFFDDIMQALQNIQTIKGSTDVSFWVGETGWPTGGDNFGDAYPTTDNAAQFFQEGICAIRAWGVNTFIFEWKDEPYKDSGVEQNFGVMDQNNNLKYSLSCDF